ncbi:MAG: 4-hydroxy-tetrahydrodipicolinate reductase [Lachnospiraceae bacterium]|nr:4-hydroxy-tetrahydrodipicolinate reductase [Lachnospiraceae bacterium]
MTRIIMHGACGRMGRVISDIVKEDADAEIVAGVDIAGRDDAGYPVFTDINACDVEADVIIDFTTASAVDGLLDYAVKKNLPVVLCSTGLSTEQLDKVRETSAEIAILKSANMSLGVNTILGLLKSATKVFVPAGFDVEIVEQHHHNKLDAPSGTAIALADAINEAADGQFEYIYNRSDRRAARDKKELGISAVRAGSIPGTHDVIFAGQDEVIEIRHIAYSRSIFGVGAVSAAKFLAGKKPGMYDMQDVNAAQQN